MSSSEVGPGGAGLLRKRVDRVGGDVVDDQLVPVA